MDTLRGGIKIQMGDMGGDTFFADILCNNQLYIVWGGGYQIWIVIDICCCLFDTYNVGGRTNIEHVYNKL